MAQLTPQAFAAKIMSKVEAIERENLPLKIAAQTVHAMRILRIFHKGIDRTMTKIKPEYNKWRPIYASDDQLRRAGSHKGKTGKAIKTTYFKSYYALKKAQGFDPNVVNSRMTNNLQSDFANQNLSPSSDTYPANAAPIRINANHYVERLDRAENVKKLRYLRKRNGRFTDFTKQERETFDKVFAYEMKRLISA